VVGSFGFEVGRVNGGANLFVRERTSLIQPFPFGKLDSTIVRIADLRPYVG